MLVNYTHFADRYTLPDEVCDYCLTDYYHKKSFTELENLDDKKRELALKYLKLGAEKGNKNCQNILGHYYLEGKFVEKDIVKGNELIKKSGIE